jgi:hypothetical protein
MPTEEDVDNDMEMQKKWVLLARPRASMLKFRLRYKTGDPIVKYLGGEVRLQAWAPVTSSETRLIVTSFEDHKYVVADYDSQLFYNNRILRDWVSFDHGIPYNLVKGLDSCFDCALEAHMWRKYAAKFIDKYNSMTRDEQNAEVASLFTAASKEVKRSLLEPPHGIEPDVLIKDKRERLVKFL